MRQFAATELNMDPRQEISRLLEKHRAELVRKNKHEIYRLPNGQIFVTGTRRGNERGVRNRLAQLRRILGVKPAANGGSPQKRKLIAGKRDASKDALDFVSVQSPSEMRSLASELKRLFPELRRQQSKK